MNPAELEQAKALFALALEQTAAERPAFLDQACQDEPKLRANVEALLSAAKRSPDAPALPTVPHPADQTASETTDAAGATIGPYKLLQLIGEGGFGSVFMAEQQHPVRRRVALKIIKLGMDTRAVIARFDAERQALAMMDHPNIAKILDAGETATGRPYFVMELVKGIPITQYCDMNKLPTVARLELFVAVCNALQHAHQKGIIHRDIKPSNILVTLHDGKPVPKLIDFGIAKATQARLTEMTLFTEFRQFIGTPAYMSPEQAEMSGLDVDTRSDIYSLGVLLYELLTGTTPFDPKELRAAGYAEIQRIIREVDPPRPSTRLSTLGVPLATIAANRDVEPRKLNQLVRGELDWIVMKALEKDRTRRYESAGEFSRDIGRHLEDQPVEACPPSRGYRLRKFVQRNRAAVSTSGLIAVLALGATGFYIHAIRAEQQKTESALADTRLQRAETEKQKRAADQQRDEAQKQEKNATSISAFLSNMLSSADPQRLLGDKVTVVQAIEAAVQQLDGGSGRIDPLTEASLRETIGTTLMGLGRYHEAEISYRKAVEIRRRILAPIDLQTASSLRCLGAALVELNKPHEAEPLYREALAMQRELLPADNPEVARTLVDLANLLTGQNKPEEAEAIYRQALNIFRKSRPAVPLSVSSTLVDLASLLAARNRTKEAEPMLREAVAIERVALPAGHPDRTNALNSLADLLSRENKPVDSEKLFREALAIERATLPAGHPAISLTLNNFASMLSRQNKKEDAQKLYREALEIDRKALPPGHPQVAHSLNNLATVLPAADAEPLYRKALEIQSAAAPDGSPEVGSAMANLANVMMILKKYDEAEKLIVDALAMLHRTLPPGHPQIATALKAYAYILMAQNRNDEAEPMLREAMEINRKSLGDHPTTIDSLIDLARLVASDKPAEAEKLYREALVMEHKVLPAGAQQTMFTLFSLSGLLLNHTRLQEAEPLFRETLDDLRKYYPEKTSEIGNACNNLGYVLFLKGDYAGAEPLLRESLGIREKELGMHHQWTRLTAETLTKLLDATGRKDEAIKVRDSHGVPDK